MGTDARSVTSVLRCKYKLDAAGFLDVNIVIGG